MNTEQQKLSDRIPDSAVVTDLLDQLTAQLNNIGVPDIPLGPIQEVAASLDITLPDPGEWANIIPSDVVQNINSFPAPDTLIEPFRGPLENIQHVISFDYAQEFQKIKLQFDGVPQVDVSTPQEFISNLQRSLFTVTDTIQQSPLMKLFADLGALFGLDGLSQFPDDASRLAKYFQDVFKERIGGLITGVASVGSLATISRKVERDVKLLVGHFSLEHTNQRFQDYLSYFGEGSDSLSARLTSLDFDDSGVVEQLKSDLQRAGRAFKPFHEHLVRDLAFTDASLNVLDIDGLSTSFNAISSSLSSIPEAPLKDVAASFANTVTDFQNRLAIPGGLTAASFTETINTTLLQLAQELEKVDLADVQDVLAGVVDTFREPLTQVENLKVQVETAVRDAYAVMKSVLDRVDISPVRATFEQAMQRVETKLLAVEDLLTAVREGIEDGLNQVKNTLAEAKNFLLDPDTGLKVKIEGAFDSVVALLKQLNIQGVLDEIRDKLASVTGALEKIEFSPVIDAAVDAIEAVADVLKTVAPLLVTDDLKQKLQEASTVLKEVDFEDIRQVLIDGFDEIIATIDQEALGRFEAEYNKVIEAVDRLDPAPLLQKIQQEVFDPLIAELEKIDPATLLLPLQEAFDTTRQVLVAFDPRQAFSFLTDLFNEITRLFEQISPDRLLLSLEESIGDIKNGVVETLRLDDLLALIGDMEKQIRPLIDAIDISGWMVRLAPGFALLRQAIQDFDPSEFLAPISAALRQIFVQTGLVIDKAGLGFIVQTVQSGSVQLQSLFDELTELLESKHTELSQFSLQDYLMPLRSRHDALKNALLVHDPASQGYAEIHVLIDALDPMPALSPVTSRLSQLQQNLSETVAAFAGMVGQVSSPIQKTEALLITFRELLNPFDQLKTIFRSLIGSVVADSPEAGIRSMVLQFLDVINPSKWQHQIQEIIGVVKRKLQVLVSDVVLGPLRQTVESVKGLVDLLDISALTAVINQVHGDVADKIRSFDPTPFLQEVDNTYKKVVGVLDRLDPSSLVAQIDTLYKEEVIGVVKAISPEVLLLEPLRSLFDEIKELLTALDIKTIFEPVLGHLTLLRNQLEEGLTKTGDAYSEMLEAIPA